MRLSVNDPQATKVAAVFLNGKRIAMPVGFDTDEGWVEMAIPQVPSMAQEGSVGDNSEPGEFEYKIVRLSGQVVVQWLK
jgi:hypothetical protein